jgi:hypothetical protein
MASDLKWRTGFGWGAISIIASAGVGAWLSAGVVRLLAIAIALVAGAYMIYQYWKWNRRGWRQVHFRAMLAYSGIAGREHAIARQAAREFDLGKACAELGLLLCGEDKMAAVDAMLTDLINEQGAFLAGLVERHAAEVLPGASLELRCDVIARLRGVRLGPQLVIASVIENTYGGAEAARYALALVAGDAD